MATHTATLQIAGMHCGSCENKISSALLRIQGVESAEVSSQDGTARVTSDAQIEQDTLEQAVASAGQYTVQSADLTGHTPPEQASQPASSHHSPTGDEAKESLYPLLLIVGFIAGVTLLIAAGSGTWAVEPMMRHFMAGFFIVFSFFKLLDPPGFVSAYRGYDLVARKVPAWGWAYLFVELALGVAYLLAFAPIATNTVTLVLMLIGSAGVLKALLDKRAIRCACLGTALNLPMTKVTLVEDLTMAAMAGVMLVLML